MLNELVIDNIIVVSVCMFDGVSVSGDMFVDGVHGKVGVCDISDVRVVIVMLWVISD